MHGVQRRRDAAVKSRTQELNAPHDGHILLHECTLYVKYVRICLYLYYHIYTCISDGGELRCAIYADEKSEQRAPV